VYWIGSLVATLKWRLSISTQHAPGWETSVSPYTAD
jgi:hypothetical protein